MLEIGSVYEAFHSPHKHYAKIFSFFAEITNNAIGLVPGQQFYIQGTIFTVLESFGYSAPVTEGSRIVRKYIIYKTLVEGKFHLLWVEENEHHIFRKVC